MSTFLSQSYLNLILHNQYPKPKIIGSHSKACHHQTLRTAGGNPKTHRPQQFTNQLILRNRPPSLPDRIQLRLKLLLLQQLHHFIRRIIIKPAPRPVAQYKCGENTDRNQQPHLKKGHCSNRRFFFIFVRLYMMKRTPHLFYILFSSLCILISKHLRAPQERSVNPAVRSFYPASFRLDLFYAGRPRGYSIFLRIICTC